MVLESLRFCLRWHNACDEKLHGLHLFQKCKGNFFALNDNIFSYLEEKTCSCLCSFALYVQNVCYSMFYLIVLGLRFSSFDISMADEPSARLLVIVFPVIGSKGHFSTHNA